VERKSISLKYLPKADVLVYQPNASVTIITNEGTELTKNVQSHFEKEGRKVVILSFSEAKNGHFSNEIILKNTDDASVKEAIAQIIAKYGAIGNFIHLHPHFEFQHGNFAQHFFQEKSILKTVFLLAKYLQPSLTAQNTAQRTAFMTVTRLDGQLGLGKRGNISILGGGFSGLVKSLNLEWSSVFCRAIDIQPEFNAEIIAQNIFTELHDANVNHTEIGIFEGGRTTFSTEKTPLHDSENIATDMTASDVFLVSGGARGVTASCIIEMAAKFKNKFILVGRSSIENPLPNYAIHENNEAALKALIMNDLKEKTEKVDISALKKTYNAIIAKKEIEETLSKIKANGGEVAYIAGDVNDLSGIKGELHKITQKWGQITGIVHGAGMLADKFIQNKTEADFNNVLSVKLDGLLSMLKIVNLNTLKHLVLFSSVAGFYGNVGQTDYAIANEILSKAAHLFKKNHPKTKVSAINWGAWEGGMVSPELKKKFLEAGVVLVNHAGGAAMFINEFNEKYDDQPQVIIGGTLPTPQSALSSALKTYHIQRNLSITDNPFLQHHAIHGNPVLPVVNAASWMADACLNLYPDFTLDTMDNLQLFKGITFNNTATNTYFTNIKETQKSPTSLVFEVEITSKGAKLPVYHYKSQVTLRHKSVVKIANPIQPSTIASTKKIIGAQLYKDGSLFHGAYFQGIEEILDYTDTYLVLKCAAKSVPLTAQGQFPVHAVNTFFLDIQYQGMLIWVQKFHNGAKSLPLHTQSSTVYKELPFDKTLYVRLDIKENSPFKMTANCTVFDENGAVYQYTEGAAVTVSPQLQW
jgi:NAD(P)-dependent dehydrogenase (short-subunit alcohol dehydrogenase family)